MKLISVLNILCLLILAMVPFALKRRIAGMWVTTNDVLILCTFAVWVFYRLRYTTIRELVCSIKENMVTAPIVLFIASLFLSAVSAGNVSLVIKETVKFIEIFVVYILFLDVLSNKKNGYTTVFWVITAGALFAGIAGIASYILTPVTFGLHRAVGTYDQPNALATYLNITMPLTLVFMWDKKWIEKLVIAVSLVIQLVAMVLTLSRGSWLALGVALFFVGLIKYTWRTVVIAGLLIILGLTFSPDIVMDRVKSSFNKFDSSIQARLLYMNTAFVMAADNPLTGVGSGNFQYVSTRYNNGAEFPEMVHNIMLQIFAEQGIPGLIAYIWMYLAVLYFWISKYEWMNENELQVIWLGVLGCIISVFVSIQFGDPFVHGIKELYIFTFALPFIIYANALNSEKENRL
ncbi:MAG: O-antigen ligase family protein [Elusimicrobiota bacterium]